MNQADNLLYIAIYDFDARTSEEISLKKGDLIKIVDNSDDDWWLVSLVLTKCQGFVQKCYIVPKGSLYTEEWYFGNVHREYVEEQLSSNIPKGTFIVRGSEKNKKFVLAIRCVGDVPGERVKHYRIHHERGFYFVERRNKFCNISELIAYYQQNADFLCCKLREPVIKAKPVRQKKYVELDKDKLGIEKVIGECGFSVIWKGIYGKMAVIVKVQSVDITSEALLEEAKIMRNLKHENLIQMLGVCLDKKPFNIVLENMEIGSLLNYVKDVGKTIDMIHLVNMAEQIANGMSYLHSQNYVHMGLMACHVLVDNQRNCKIADFSIASELVDNVYIVNKPSKFPIRWTAPEIFCYGYATKQSDIWSFGVLLSELFNQGQTPYLDMKNTDIILQKVENGYRMSKPVNCPNKMYDIMLKCWEKDADARPTFDRLHLDLMYYSE